MADQPAAALPPSVSVVIPVWNVEPYLRECLDSVVNQSIGPDRVQVVAVDDGSTDGSGRILDEYAARDPRVVVLHEPNSGGPGRPRNIGLDHATGTYVFFLDADDYLGPEALERLVAMAERNGSDIVLGMMVGIDGRRIYRMTGAFRRNEDRIDLERVYRSGNVQKLFRRSMVERAGLRFRERVAGDEDGEFMGRAYLEATTISVLADYDSYFIRRREGSQTNRADRSDDLVEYIARLESDRIRLLADRRKPGIGRDMLMLRHIRKMLRKFGRRWRAREPEARRLAFEAAAGIIDRWHTPMIQRALPAWAALRAYCIGHGLYSELEDIAGFSPAAAFRDPLVERGRLYARYPHFRDGSGIPDSCFDITREVIPQHTLAHAAVVGKSLELSGQAYLTLVGGTTSVELRRWPRGPRFRIDTTPVATPGLRDLTIPYPMAGYEVAIDLGAVAGGRPLPRGTWTIHLSIGTEAVRRSIAVRVGRPTDSHAADVVRGGGLRITAARELRLRTGRPRPLDQVLERLEGISVRVRRAGLRVVTASRAGRILEMAMQKVRPGLGANLGDD